MPARSDRNDSSTAGAVMGGLISARLRPLRWAGLRRWLLFGIGGFFVVLALQPLWDACVINSAGIAINRAMVAGSQSDRSALIRAMDLLQTTALRGPHNATREVPIWRTYGAAASLVPSDRAVDTLLNSQSAGYLDRFGELWLGEVASAVQRWEEAAEAYSRVDASNVLIHRAELYLDAGVKDLAVHEYTLAKASLDAALARESAERLLVDSAGEGSSATDSLARRSAERVTALYRIGYGLLAADEPLRAIPALEQALEKAAADSPGVIVEQSIGLSLALALAQTLPKAPTEVATSYDTSTQSAEKDRADYVSALTRIYALTFTALNSERTAPTCVRAARVLLLVGDDAQGVALLREAMELDPLVPAAYLALGEWYQGQGMTTMARLVYEKGMQKLPANSDLAVACAIVSYKTLAADKALTQLEWAAQTETTDPYLFALLGDCYVDLGQVDQARAAYEEGLRRAPRAEPLISRLAAMMDLSKPEL